MATYTRLRQFRSAKPFTRVRFPSPPRENVNVSGRFSAWPDIRPGRVVARVVAPISATSPRPAWWHAWWHRFAHELDERPRRTRASSSADPYRRRNACRTAGRIPSTRRRARAADSAGRRASDEFARAGPGNARRAAPVNRAARRYSASAGRSSGRARAAAGRASRRRARRRYASPSWPRSLSHATISTTSASQSTSAPATISRTCN